MPASSSLRGLQLDSEMIPGVSYKLVRLLAHGGMGSAYFAERVSPLGSSPVVVKVMHPYLAGGQVSPMLLAVKETVALGRLSEQVPPTPYVVRYIDSGSNLTLGLDRTAWVALEHINGGIEGTTLEDRVEYAVHRTGYAFDPARAARAITCIQRGLTAIHDVSVLHRDLSPGNVLCCGFGDAEVFKISDFGVARPLGLDRTFQGMRVGTLGYTAPEASSSEAGPASDVFSLAAMVYFFLTGQHYFEVDHPQHWVRLVASPHRPSVRLHATLSPEFVDRPEDCAHIDQLLSRATALDPSLRPKSAAEFAQLLVPSLSEAQPSPHSSHRVVQALLSDRRRQTQASGRWIIKCPPGGDRLIHGVAWQSDGRALALTKDGALFWDGNVWLDAQSILRRIPFPVLSFEPHDRGGWLACGSSRSIGVVDATGELELLQTPDSSLRYCLASGHTGGQLLALRTLDQSPGSSGFWPSEDTELVLFTARQAGEPFALPHGLQINCLKRLDEHSWLLGGRLRSGGGFASLYLPAERKLTPLSVPTLRAFIAGASCPERAQALLAGSDGVALTVSALGTSLSVVETQPDFAAAAVDLLGNTWLGSVGKLWHRGPAESTYHPVWGDPQWTAPFISMMAEPGRVLAVGCDGAVLEGLFDFTPD